MAKRVINDSVKAAAALHYRVGHTREVSQTLMGNLDLYDDHMSTEGSLAFNCDYCHAYSMRGSMEEAPTRHTFP